MRNEFLNKLKSNRGASLTFALLLFIVCAAVGSVVIAAASGAVGRASGDYEYDRRYYAVTSAAELFRDTLGGQAVTIDVQKNAVRTVTSVVTLKEDGSGEYSSSDVTVPPEAPAPEYKRLLQHSASLLDVSFDETSLNLLDQAAIALLGSLSDAELFAADGLSLDAAITRDLTLTIADPNDAGAPGVTVDVTETIQKDGSLTFVFSNHDAGDKYLLQLTLTAAIVPDSTRSEVRNEQASGVSSEETQYTYTDGNGQQQTGTAVTTTSVDVYDITEHRTFQITWAFSGIGKVVKTAS